MDLKLNQSWLFLLGVFLGWLLSPAPRPTKLRSDIRQRIEQQLGASA